MTPKEMIEHIISEMLCANDCAMYHKWPYLMDTCTCYKKEMIKAIDAQKQKIEKFKTFGIKAD